MAHSVCLDIDFFALTDLQNLSRKRQFLLPLGRLLVVREVYYKKWLAYQNLLL